MDSYNYIKNRDFIFTEDGVKMLRKLEARCNELLNFSGAFTWDKAVETLSGSTWDMAACVDYLVEQGAFKEKQEYGVKVYIK